MLTLEARALGRKQPLVPEWTVPLPAGTETGGALTLRDLLTEVVRGEVSAFQQRQADRQFLQVLTPEQISTGAARGKVDSGGSDLKQKVNVDDAIHTALQAFEDGIYLVLVDGVEQRSLDAQVPVTANSRVLFLRLSLLAGG